MKIPKVGDQVVLKSGGPVMTVGRLHENAFTGKTETCECQWFVGAKLQNGDFSFEVLDPAPKDKGK